ncbi:MAG: DNA/RNA nuclease SfsA, partial [Proteobacteria bacterium]|nr:DNA/RNA nuclease SfsA [Pseudomonadota bacterium]
PNRFLGKVKRENGEIAEVHVHDPGRLKELLYEGNEVLIRRAKNENRKTKWDLIAAKSEGKWILVNSSFHRNIAEAIIKNRSVSLFRDFDKIMAEVKNGDSRIDFLLIKKDRKMWVEVKGCTLKKGKAALFPDAPTLRGRKHLLNLIDSVKRGDESAVLILIFVDAEIFSPNKKTDPEFSDTLKKAYESGVKIYTVVLDYQKNYIHFKGEIPILF